MNKIYHSKKLIFVFCFLLSLLNIKGVTRVSLASGNWTAAANWSPAGAPACGDSIVIQTGHTVTITTQQDYEGCALPLKITIFGTLRFENGNKLKLPCGSKIHVATGGSIEAGGGGGNSNNIEICDTVVWNAGDGEYTGPSCLPPTPCNAQVLPVELSSFTATVNNKLVDLLWTTQTEKNNSRFDIERSDDAFTFKKIASENTKANGGNSMVPLKYVSSDPSPLANTNYYRLRQVDNDGTFVNSKIISVTYVKESNIKFIVYPNPNHGEFTADISGVENNHNVIILLSDIQGKLVYRSNFFIQDSQNTKIQIVPEDKIPNGVYVCTLMIEEIAFAIKVVVN